MPSAFNQLSGKHRAPAHRHASRRDDVSSLKKLSLRCMARTLCALWLLLMSANVMNAIPLHAYRERVHKAADALDSLRWSSDEDESEAARSARIAETVRQVRQAVMSVETVEWNRTPMQVDNAWLDQSLADYEKTKASDTHRADALLSIEERLYALDERLAEMEGGQTNRAAQSKDEEKARLAAILRRDEYNKKVAEESALARLRTRFLKWLDSLFPDAQPVQSNTASAGSRTTQLGVLCLCLAGIAFLLWRFGPRLFTRTIRRRGKRGRDRARVVLGEQLEEDQTASDLFTEAETLAHNGDLRAAIRKGYIALLCELADRKLLSLAQSKTNRDYLRAVQGVEPLHSEMRQLTNVFENHWYGFAPASPNDWTNFRAGYKKAVTSDE
ncbi:MAG TPA: DUF4129 domain-containing protein [Pyrinomonadaceae bacterium]|nr:DUF4129 domain-containing protein [Pyrinomonadaceae bacterium]